MTTSSRPLAFWMRSQEAMCQTVLAAPSGTLVELESFEEACRVALARATPFVYQCYEYQQALNQTQKDKPVMAVAPQGSLGVPGVRTARHRGVHWSWMSLHFRLPRLPIATRRASSKLAVSMPTAEEETSPQWSSEKLPPDFLQQALKA
mmetsp:Transcript_102674/g.182420  ORF Transcript_102674/g.182420 Transcript_102674/m.182420 type:complete len:149 (+) Transcript_102674:856-1302(+)